MLDNEWYNVKLPDDGFITSNFTPEIRVHNEKGGVKADGGKVRPTLLFRSMPDAVAAVIRILEKGAKKYTHETEISFAEFKDELENYKWDDSIVASTVKKLSVSLVKGTVKSAIEDSCLLQYVSPVKKKNESQQETGLVEVVTKKSDFKVDLKKLLEKKIILETTSNRVNTTNLYLSQKPELDPLSITSKENLPVKSTGSESMESHMKIIKFYVKEDVQSAEAEKDHILTTTMILENLEIYFVVTATKLLDCYKTTLQLLKDSLGTSVNINLTKIQTGANNWRLVEPERYDDANLRHLLKYLAGETLDDETKESHLAHAITCLLFRLQLDYNNDKDLTLPRK